MAQKVTNNLDAYLSACQLGITLVSLGLGWIGEPTIAHLIEKPLSALGIPEVAIHTIAFIVAFAIITSYTLFWVSWLLSPWPSGELKGPFCTLHDR